MNTTTNEGAAVGGQCGCGNPKQVATARKGILSLCRECADATRHACACGAVIEGGATTCGPCGRAAAATGALRVECPVCHAGIGEHCRTWQTDYTPPHAPREARALACAQPTLNPDDSIKPCILAPGHAGYCDGGVR